jgi:hypothetical protein
MTAWYICPLPNSKTSVSVKGMEFKELASFVIGSNCFPVVYPFKKLEEQTVI